MPLNREIDKGIAKIKRWYASLTLWINGAVLVLATFWEMLPEFGAFLPQDSIYMRVVAGIGAASTILVRLFRTNEPITAIAAGTPIVESK